MALGSAMTLSAHSDGGVSLDGALGSGGAGIRPS